MDLSVVLQVVLNVAIVAMIAFPIVKYFSLGPEKIRNLKDDFIRWRQRYSKW